jgi:hypothetical protein
MDLAYDTETYLDIFCAGFVDIDTGHRWIFEVSDRVNQSPQFIQFLIRCQNEGHRFIGFNNLHFDWPVCDHLWLIFNETGEFVALDAHEKANAIIRSQNPFEHTVAPWHVVIPQVDLFKIHHFDNRARSTSLKKLEINMRSDNVIDLPYPPDEPTTSEMKDEIIAYMCHDINETAKFALISREAIDFRDKLKEKYPDLGDVVNFNDTKIGKKFFEMELEKAGTPCYKKVAGKKQPIQTIRSEIDIGAIISPKVSFRHPDMQRVLTWLSNQKIRPDQTKGFLSNGDNGHGLTATMHGFEYHFGTGGIHGSLSRATVHECDEFEIWDWDVASYYPNLAITHRYYPEHLSETFCGVYEWMFLERRNYPKGTPENATYKLALNGVYGDSNNIYGPFFDPQYTMSVTVNGQLLLCQLAEWLTHDWNNFRPLEEHIQLIQINTDGLTVRVHKSMVEYMKAVCAAWESYTGLVLESAQYKSMFVRDVNNYIALGTNGKLKRKGAYCYETPLENPYTQDLGWHQNHSMLIVPKAAEAEMVHGIKVADYIKTHRNKWDFQKSVKVPRSSRLQYGEGAIQNTTRYYVSTDGHGLTKVMPPLAKKPGVERHIGVEAGWTVTPTNDISEFRWDNVNWYYYIEEARKLLL